MTASTPSESQASESQASESLRGIVIEIRPKALYRVRLEDGRVITAKLTSQARHVISRLIVGDQVLLALTQTDPSRGQITKIAP